MSDKEVLNLENNEDGFIDNILKDYEDGNLSYPSFSEVPEDIRRDISFIGKLFSEKRINKINKGELLRTILRVNGFDKYQFPLTRPDNHLSQEDRDFIVGLFSLPLVTEIAKETLYNIAQDATLFEHYIGSEDSLHSFA